MRVLPVITCGLKSTSVAAKASFSWCQQADIVRKPAAREFSSAASQPQAKWVSHCKTAGFSNFRVAGRGNNSQISAGLNTFWRAECF